MLIENHQVKNQLNSTRAKTIDAYNNIRLGPSAASIQPYEMGARRNFALKSKKNEIIGSRN